MSEHSPGRQCTGTTSDGIRLLLPRCGRYLQHFVMAAHAVAAEVEGDIGKSQLFKGGGDVPAAGKHGRQGGGLRRSQAAFDLVARGASLLPVVWIILSRNPPGSKGGKDRNKRQTEALTRRARHAIMLFVN